MKPQGRNFDNDSISRCQEGTLEVGEKPIVLAVASDPEPGNLVILKETNCTIAESNSD